MSKTQKLELKNMITEQFKQQRKLVKESKRSQEKTKKQTSNRLKQLEEERKDIIIKTKKRTLSESSNRIPHNQDQIHPSVIEEPLPQINPEELSQFKD